MKVKKEPDEMVKFSVVLKHSTDKAWLFIIKDDAYWVPKSICEWKPTMPDASTGTITVPLWFAQKDGMKE